MKLSIKILQHGKKTREVTGSLTKNPSHDVLRKIFEAEQTLNSLPTDLRFHISVKDDEMED